MSALLEWIIPGLLKRNCRRAIHNLALLARYESQRQQLPPMRAVLWETLSGAAAGFIQQLFVHNPDPWLDWGLKKNRRRLSKQAICHIYFWMVLYQLVLFRTYGVEGYSTEEEFSALCIVAQQFIEYVTSAKEISVELPRPWDEAWDTQGPDEAATGLYKSVLEGLGLPDKTEKRMIQVALFTTESHRLYDLIVRRIVSKRTEER
jgi:hypothetical protein